MSSESFDPLGLDLGLQPSTVLLRRDGLLVDKDTDENTEFDIPESLVLLLRHPVYNSSALTSTVESHDENEKSDVDIDDIVVVVEIDLDAIPYPLNR